MRVYRFEREQILPRGRDAVFSFFENAANLERITPPFLRFQIVTPQPIEMRVGTLIDYRIRLFRIKMSWRTRIDMYRPPFMFVDRQVRGPYRHWVHTHEFHPYPNESSTTQTIMYDRVDYSIGFGPFGELARRVLVARTLDKIFAFRRQAITTLLSDPSM